MSRFAFIAVALAVAGGVIAAPVPSVTPANVLVAGLSDPDEKVRNESARALQNRADALPWLRRATRSTDKDTVRRASALLATFDNKRQTVVPKMIDACIRDGQADLFMEWHHYWQPESKDELWPVGPRMGKAALNEFAKRWPEEKTNHLEDAIASMYFPGVTRAQHDGPQPARFREDLWHLRTDRLSAATVAVFHFASVAGPTELFSMRMGYYFALGQATAKEVQHSVVVSADGFAGIPYFEQPSRVRFAVAFVVCRGDVVIPGSNVTNSILLVDGDIDLSRSELKNSTVRASGAIQLPPNVKPVNCTIEAHAKNATAPYKFFELADVGLSLADDEEGLVVTEVKAETPFGNCGLAKGDLIRAIDDAPAGHSEEFRKKVRRALVRQGDCLLTVVRGDKTLDLPVFFPLPK